MMRKPLHPARSAGVGLVTAIFLLVVLSGLGVAMVALYTTHQASATLDIQGARAYPAARAGIEWGLWQRRRGTCPAGVTIVTMPDAPTLRGFTVAVSCTQAAGAPNAPATITAFACNMADANGRCDQPRNDPDYVRRQIEVQA